MPVVAAGGMSGGLNANRNTKNIKKQRKRKEKKKTPNNSDEFLEDVEHVEYKNTKLGKFLDIIDPFILVLIIVNAIQMGLATFDFVSENEKVDSIFEKVDQIFLIIFTVEVCLNFWHHNRFDRITMSPLGFAPKSEQEEFLRKENFPWLVFDALVVIFSWAFASLSIIRAFRILRVLRVINKVEQLKSVVGALIGVLPKMGVVAFLLSLLFMIFGVSCTILFGDLYEKGRLPYNYFGQFDLSLLTLFQLMTFDNMAEVARDVMDVYPWSWTVFVLWAIITGFVAMNLIIAIICESLVNLSEQKKLEKELEQRAVEKLNLSEKNKLSREDSRKLKMETMSLMESQKSMKSLKSTGTNNTDGYVFQLEELVGEILEDQEDLIETVDEIKRLFKESLDNPPSEQRKKELHTFLGL
ncbi:bacterial type voltage activated sodium channel [Chaetoceros tenuissimus]|uniref:Bacterial type voltage activated sodium channel n=1 Tax=Chaetoceros tenuissimus TaxID=426638 RepID=A0AAD3CMG9_9STRA|nr:bacterial type voltage activated sodium channel [Chaetoceros tenuissimus]